MLLPSEHELLLRIIETPDDDHQRLVLADLLNARGEPLGELITVQCALEALCQGQGRGDYRTLKARERELLTTHRARWHQQAAPFARELEFRRGLPEVLHASCDALLDDGGLTVLAPIRELILNQVDGPIAAGVTQLPLLQRIERLCLQGLGGVSLFPLPALPHRVKQLKLEVRQFIAFEAVVNAGWLEHLETLELGLRWLEPEVIDLVGAAPNLRQLRLFGAPERGEDVWERVLEALLELRPELELRWRGTGCDRSTLPSEVRARSSRSVEVVPLEREPFGQAEVVATVGREMPDSLKLERLASGCLVARSEAPAFVEDARLQLSLPPHATRINAVASAPGALRYEAWPARSLHEVGLPLAPPLALRAAAGIALGLEALSPELEQRGVRYWPAVLSLDDVWLGDDGAVKLLPPFRHINDSGYSRIEEQRTLGLPIDSQLWDTVTGRLFLCGTALLHLLVGEPPVDRPRSRLWTPAEVVDISRELEVLRDRPLLPSVFKPEWKPIDPLVFGCLARSRSRQFVTLSDFARECLAQSTR